MVRKPLENSINYHTLKIVNAVIQYIILKKKFRFTEKQFENIKVYILVTITVGQSLIQFFPKLLLK